MVLVADKLNFKRLEETALSKPRTSCDILLKNFVSKKVIWSTSERNYECE